MGGKWAGRSSKSRKCFEVFKSLGFKNENDSFVQNKVVSNIVVSFATVKEKMRKMILGENSYIRFNNL